jgi:alginate O-acetyltransferase complex protein AlgI
VPFHSPGFLLLCLATLALYYLGRERWQHGVLLAASLVFYAAAGAADTLLLLGAVAVNHLLAGPVAARRPRALPLALALNLGLLLACKGRGLLGQAIHGSDAGAVAIPLGVSFYVFQLIAYQVELSRGTCPREPSGRRLLLYILFFPHHQAGPIMRPAAFLPQFYGARRAALGQLGAGALWILWGLCKKVAADHVGEIVDLRFAHPEAMVTAALAWRTALLYAFQIYGDFSGYSDMALGLGLLFGYRLDRNFAQPYLAKSPGELWRRWHVTLSRWLRDYLYIPLGGSRGGRGRTLRNLLLTMALGGLWHGVSPLFLLWGVLHGLLLCAARLRWPRSPLLGWALTFSFTVIAWVPFRAPSWPVARALLHAMLGGPLGPPAEVARTLLVGLGLVGAQWLEERALGSAPRRAALRERWLAAPPLLRGAALGLLTVALLLALRDGTAYIYFRF